MLQRFSKELAVEMRINFSGGNAFVSKHFLYGTEVCATFNQVCGKRMPERVWGNSFMDSGLLYQVFYYKEDHDP